MTNTAPRSNGWNTIRRTLTPVLAVVTLTLAGYVPGALAVAAIMHVTGVQW